MEKFVRRKKKRKRSVEDKEEDGRGRCCRAPHKLAEFCLKATMKLHV